VTPLRYFGTDLVAYRKLSGELIVMDRHCQHLGASLAHGGCVTEEGIRCPFHGWVWDENGYNVSIPYAARPNRARRIRPWHVTEKDEVIYLWHDADGQPPAWEVPDVFVDLGRAVRGKNFLPAWPRGTGHFAGTNVHPQMVLENAVDPAHFHFVHNTPGIPVLLHQDVSETTWAAVVGFGNRWQGPVFDEDSDLVGTLSLLSSGIGIAFNALVGRDETTLVLIATTPVDDQTSDLFQTVWLEEIDDESEDRLEMRFRAALDPLPQDIEIWNNQKYLDPAGLTASEVRGFNEIRKWGKRFLGPRSTVMAQEADDRSSRKASG
jgi:phenylpropionate dioxygenase-like ring-hydroxylating dioxygenase large terminal subunit